MLSSLRDYLHDHWATMAKGACGLTATAGSAILSVLENVEAWLRVASLLVGISVGLVTIWSMVKQKK